MGRNHQRRGGTRARAGSAGQLSCDFIVLDVAASTVLLSAAVAAAAIECDAAAVVVVAAAVVAAKNTQCDAAVVVVAVAALDL